MSEDRWVEIGGVRLKINGDMPEPPDPPDPPDPPAEYEVLDQKDFKDKGDVTLTGMEKFIIDGWDLRGRVHLKNCSDCFITDSYIHDSQGDGGGKAPWDGLLLDGSRQVRVQGSEIARPRGHCIELRNGSEVICHDTRLIEPGEDALQTANQDNSPPDKQANYFEFYGGRIEINGPEGDPRPENLIDMKSGAGRVVGAELLNYGQPGGKHGENIIMHRVTTELIVEDSLLAYRWRDGGKGGKAFYNVGSGVLTIGECQFDLARDNKWGLSSGRDNWDKKHILEGINKPYCRVYGAEDVTGQR